MSCKLITKSTVLLTDPSDVSQPRCLPIMFCLLIAGEVLVVHSVMWRNGPWAMFKWLAFIFCLLWFRDAQDYHAHDTTGKIFWAWAQCSTTTSLPPLRNRKGACGPYPIHPCRPLVFIGTDTKWPLHHHQHTQTDTNMLPWSERRLDGVIPKLLLRDLWAIANNKGKERGIAMLRVLILFINIWEFILTSNKTAWGISDYYSPPLCSINVRSWTS